MPSPQRGFFLLASLVPYFPGFLPHLLRPLVYPGSAEEALRTETLQAKGYLRPWPDPGSSLLTGPFPFVATKCMPGLTSSVTGPQPEPILGPGVEPRREIPIRYSLSQGWPLSHLDLRVSGVMINSSTVAWEDIARAGL